MSLKDRINDKFTKPIAIVERWPCGAIRARRYTLNFDISHINQEVLDRIMKNG